MSLILKVSLSDSPIPNWKTLWGFRASTWISCLFWQFKKRKEIMSFVKEVSKEDLKIQLFDYLLTSA